MFSSPTDTYIRPSPGPSPSTIAVLGGKEVSTYLYAGYIPH
jgi:hypothetical protein